MAIKALRFLAAAIMLAFVTSAAAQTSVDEAERGIVRVVVILQTSEGRMLYGSGSGFVVAPNLVVTNAHVVAAARQGAEYGVAVVPPQGDGLLPATIIRYSPLTELALLEFRGEPDLTPLTISTVEPHTGDGVVALGYPDVDYQGASGADLLRPAPPSRTSGQIASLRDRAPTGDPIPTINHQAIISSGSSGGPLLDECGRVIGINSWHVSGADTRETRGVSTRVAQLLQFLDEAGVTPTLSDERCLSFAERMQAERSATIDALHTQNQELEAKLETADRLTRIAVVILIGGTLALFVAVCVLGAIVLSRRRTNTHAAPHAHVQHHEPEPFEAPRKRMGVMTIVGGAAVAAILIVAAGIALMRAQNQQAPQIAEAPNFSGAITCTLDREASSGAQGVADMSFSASGALCVNERTLYAPIDDAQHFRRLIVLGEARALDVLTIDPASGEFRRERYPLDETAFAAANQAVSSSSAGRGCSGEGASEAVTRRNETLMRFAQGEPSQRLVWRCEQR
ncbi:MAG: trypsin-like peptidase domain-containing protein [Phycisphaerales bacterium]|nr:trypsin-like peptidase domain-containing protein [Hyphomonadaceae bacterium]